jgi:peptide/nickel transport system substrate-binding protein
MTYALISKVSRSSKWLLHTAAVVFATMILASQHASALDLIETPMLVDRVQKKALPPVAKRVPTTPLVVDMAARGREAGRHGGEIVTLVARSRDIRYVSAYSYARLIGYDADLKLQNDLVEHVEVEGERVFTFKLRAGHRWSDGHPFTSEDMRYWWEDVANSKDLSPAGPPEFMMVDGKPPLFEVLDAQRVRYTWDAPNPRFMPTLAQPRDPFIYRPAHYLKPFHARYGDSTKLDVQARGLKMKSWAALHNRIDDMFENSNPALPTLQAWRITNAAPATRFVFERNPYYHRVDPLGRQLPYLDRIIADVATGGLMAAKANAGEADLLARGLNMNDMPILKEGEKAKNYRTLLWPIGRGSEVTLFPNLTVSDPVWRKLNRDVRFRRALSLAIDRRTLNNSLMFGLGVEGNNTVREGSTLSTPELRKQWAVYDRAQASSLLDSIGLTERDGAGIRQLPDGRPLEIIVEVDGEAAMTVDALELISEFWREVGIKLFIKPQDRTILRNRVYSGLTVMTAATGLDNAVPTPIMPPSELAPMRQDHYGWAKWGQFIETKGQQGEAIDMDGPRQLMEAYQTWAKTGDMAVKEAAWRSMLRQHADQQWTIGTISGAIQPVVLRNGLQNLPKQALYSWEPTSLLGVYRIDEIFWQEATRKEATKRGEVTAQ